jgi:hypothetical protein
VASQQFSVVRSNIGRFFCNQHDKHKTKELFNFLFHFSWSRLAAIVTGRISYTKTLLKCILLCLITSLGEWELKSLITSLGRWDVD